MKIRRNDIVLLPDGSEGKVLDTIATQGMEIYKINKQGHEDYFDESKVRLKKRHLLNLLLCFFNL